VETELTRHIEFLNSAVGQFLLRPVSWQFFKTPLEGAQTTLYCALASELEGVSGKYYR
jgi:retinol dehydrogenase-14